jgi:misacylated tRNA(Ala) deacylase
MPKEYSSIEMHTAEHILNQTMVRMFGCDRSKTSHIERKKSKCDYLLPEAPTEQQLKEVSDKVNEVICQNLDVTAKMVPFMEVPASVDLSKLPEGVGETLRLVYVGEYDICACIGQHVTNTSEIGKFVLISYDYADGKFRVRFKLEDRE